MHIMAKLRKRFARYKLKRRKMKENNKERYVYKLSNKMGKNPSNIMKLNTHRCHFT